MDIVPEITRRSITRLINDGKRADGRAFVERLLVLRDGQEGSEVVCG